MPIFDMELKIEETRRLTVEAANAADARQIAYAMYDAGVVNTSRVIITVMRPMKFYCGEPDVDLLTALQYIRGLKLDASKE